MGNTSKQKQFTNEKTLEDKSDHSIVDRKLYIKINKSKITKTGKN